MYQQRLIPSEKFDNSARSYGHIQALPVASSMGAEICGADLKNMTQEVFEEVQDALFRHKAIFFRNQKLSHAEHLAFSERFGEVTDDPYSSEEKDVHPHIVSIGKEANVVVGRAFGGGWHSDSPFLEKPPALTILRSVDVPPYGGDTLFADAALAYRALTPTMQKVLSSLRIHMSSKRQIQSLKSKGTLSREYATTGLEEKAFSGQCHPLVRTHPYTGEKSIYVAGGYSAGIEGMNEDESSIFIDFLMSHVIQHAMTCRIRWEPDMILMWDNRSCLHQAPNDYDGYRREMYRSMVAGEIPQ